VSYFDNVQLFQRMVAQTKLPDAPQLLEPDLMSQRVKHLLEEVDELRAAARVGSLAAVADALADIVYIALGTAALAGIPFELVWHEVHRSNMRKHFAPALSGAYKQGVVKPEGWTPPDIASILSGMSALSRALEAVPQADGDGSHACDETCIPWCGQWPSGPWAKQQAKEAEAERRGSDIQPSHPFHKETKK
jgi:predicted HAD superfamily Cof-like phosphohydrolase